MIQICIRTLDQNVVLNCCALFSWPKIGPLCSIRLCSTESQLHTMLHRLCYAESLSNLYQYASPQDPEMHSKYRVISVNTLISFSCFSLWRRIKASINDFSYSECFCFFWFYHRPRFPGFPKKWVGWEERDFDGKTSLRHIILCKTRLFFGHLMKIHAVREFTLLTIQKPEFLCYQPNRGYWWTVRGPGLRRVLQFQVIFRPSTLKEIVDVVWLTSNSILSFQESLSMFDHLDMIHWLLEYISKQRPSYYKSRRRTQKGPKRTI